MYYKKQPLFENKLYVGRPNIGDRDGLFARINDILDRGWLTNNGSVVREFEARIENLLGVKHCIASCNATIALEIAIRALGLSGEVIVPSFTFIATAHALQWQGITPVFCDISPENHTIDPDKLERLITPRTTGIIGVHLWGHPCNIERLSEIADRRNLKLLFDAAHAFGCSTRGSMIGNFGEAEVFSFHATKFINTFEGGAVVTNNDDLAAKIRLMKNFGFSGYDSVVYIGTNGKMNEVSAAMGITGLDSLEEFVAINKRNYLAYQAGLRDIRGIRLLEYSDVNSYNYQYIVLEVNSVDSAISRDELMDLLWKENVIARRYFYPGCHKMEPYKSLFPAAGLLLPFTEILAERVLVLPTGKAIDIDSIELICGFIRDTIDQRSG